MSLPKDKPESGEWEFNKIFTPRNRGMLLDLFVFLVSLVLMNFLAGRFIALVRQASAGDEIAGFAIFLFFLAIFTLPMIGATLKRWHFHQRLALEGKESSKPEAFMSGCLFNPIFYFTLNLLIFSALNAFVMQFLYGNGEGDGAVFISSILFGLVFVLFQTYIVYRYFSRPKEAPKAAFLRDPRSEMLGDACIFLNMILFQILWNLATAFPGDRPPNVSIASEIGFRLFFLGFASLFVYFPPRMFYFAEDIKRKKIWLTILLANLPLLIRVIDGTK